jgi:hypothetical protein
MANRITAAAISGRMLPTSRRIYRYGRGNSHPALS